VLIKRLLTIFARLVPKSCNHKWVFDREIKATSGGRTLGGGYIYSCSKCKKLKTETWGLI
jgi:hypothetical protein